MAARKKYVDATALTPNEKEIYDFYRQGLKLKEIASHTSLTVRAVKNRLTIAKEKIAYGGNR
jgi:DNA-binding NarL/FixJ family response regulator